MEIDSDLQELLDGETEKVREFLIDGSMMGPDKERALIADYTAAVEPNFIPWVAATALSARSFQGRYAAQENLHEEITGDHQGMLRDFAKSVITRPMVHNFDRVELYVKNMRRTFANMDGLTNVALLAFLENTSRAFIPYLADVASNLATDVIDPDYTYTNAHGEADIKHAKQFVWALGKERASGYAHPQETISSAISTGRGFLRGIFVRNVTGE